MLRATSGDLVAGDYPDDVERALVIDMEEWSRRINADGLPPTADDQSRTWDGRVLDSKEKVLAFLEELDAARREGRTLGP